jgi:dTDP-glucose pyrophosphorylase
MKFFSFKRNLKVMKNITVLVVVVVLLAGCQKNEVVVSQFTGNETTYALQQSSQFAVSGTVTFKERKDGQIAATITLTGTQGDIQHPVHLHLGDITTVGADIALLLNPVNAITGKSETIFSKLADETTIDYQRLVQLQACVKIHLGDTGADRDVVLAAGNIGTAVADNVGGRLGVSMCKSE